MADAFGKFKITLSDDLTIPTCRKLCTYFGVKDAKTESILLKDLPGLVLLNHLESESKLAPNNVQGLYDALKHMKMDRAAVRVEEFARQIDTRLPDSLDSDEDGGIPENSSAKFTFDDLNTKCGIAKKLTLNEMLQIKDPQKLLSLAEIFWTKITSLDYRITSSDLTRNNTLSVRDLVFAILHSSDNLLRQDIIYKMSSCQLAVPLVVRSAQGKIPLFFYWAFRTIRKKYKVLNENDPVERPVFQNAVFTVSFVRIGDVRVSKSNLLNLLLSECQGMQAHSFFTHKGNDVAQPNFASGSIEAVWYAPQGGEKELLKKATAFLNLRGDSRTFKHQTKFLLKVSNLIVALIGKQNWKTYKDTIQFIKENGTNVLVVAIRKSDDEGSNPPLDCKHDEVIIVRKLQINHLNEVLCQKIDRIQKHFPNDNLLPIEAYKDTVKDFVHLDAPQEYLENLKHFTEGIVCGKKDVKVFKERILALFPRWLKWAEIDNTPITIDSGEAPGRKKIALKIEEQLEERKEQVNTELAEEVKQFWELLKLVDTNDDLYDDCMVCLRFLLFELTYEDKKGKTVLKRSKPVGEHIDLYQTYIKEARDEWEMRIGLEDFMRELGQLFEAHVQSGKNDELPAEIMRLPFLAAQFLIRGNSLEILDDKSYCIPQTWISKVIAALGIILGEASKVMVLSVIGVQGSGKSTLLNSMFGTKFPVSAGRCTRGLFIRLLKVEEGFSEDLGCKYIIVMDTEGLKADRGYLLLEKGSNSRLDNKMSTLAICLADLSIVNIDGELLSSNKTNFLEIAAYASIRMKEVDLKSQCWIIQQRVGDITAPAQNRNNMRNIIYGLDAAVKKVAKAEGLADKFERFSDIFKINVEEHTQYVPVLWSGNMSPPNPLYGEAVTKLKRQILSSIQNEGLQVPSTFQTFCSKLLAVDTALKEENFVLNFENVSRAISCHDLSMQCNKWLGDVRNEVMDKLIKWHEKLNTTLDCEREHVSEVLITEIAYEIEKQRKIVWEKFESYLKNNVDNKNTHNGDFRSWIESNLLDLEKEMEIKVSNHVKVLQLGSNYVPSIVAEMAREIRLKAVQEATSIRKYNGKRFDQEHSYDYFEKFWDESRNDLLKRYGLKQVSEKEIRTECSIFLQKLCTENAFESDFFHLLDSEGDISNHSEEFDYEKYIPNKRTNQKGVWDADEIKKEKEKARKLKVSVENIKESLLRAFAEKSKQQKAFCSNLVYSTLQNALAEISGMVNENNVKLPSSLVVKVLLHICGKISELASNSSNKDQTDSHSQELLDRQKLEIYLDFTSFYEDECQNNRAYQFICNSICEQFTKHVLHRLKFYVVSYFSGIIPQTKRTLHVEVLRYLYVANDPLKYINYINNNTEFLISWLRKKMVNMISTTADNKSWIQIRYEEVLCDIPALRTSLLQELSHSQSVPEWCEKLTEALSKDQRIRFKLEEAHVYRVSDMSKLSQNVVHYLQNIMDIKTSMIVALPDPSSPDQCEQFLQLVLNCPFENVVSKVLGCPAQCCLCKAPCIQGNFSHQTHEVLFHYPRGLTGEKCEGNKLVVDFCAGTLNLAENAVHYNKNGEFCTCKGYGILDRFTSRLITRYEGQMLVCYWKRVFHLINGYCSNYFRCEPADLPTFWASDYVALRAKAFATTLSWTELIKLLIQEEDIMPVVAHLKTSDRPREDLVLVSCLLIGRVVRILLK